MSRCDDGSRAYVFFTHPDGRSNTASSKFIAVVRKRFEFKAVLQQSPWVGVKLVRRLHGGVVFWSLYESPLSETVAEKRLMRQFGR